MRKFKIILETFVSFLGPHSYGSFLGPVKMAFSQALCVKITPYVILIESKYFSKFIYYDLTLSQKTAFLKSM